MKLNTNFLLERCADLAINSASCNGEGELVAQRGMVYAMMAIANELKRMNDMNDEDRVMKAEKEFYGL